MLGVVLAQRGDDPPLRLAINMGDEVRAGALGLDLGAVVLGDGEVAGLAGEGDGEFCCAAKIHSSTVAGRAGNR